MENKYFNEVYEAMAKLTGEVKSIQGWKHSTSGSNGCLIEIDTVLESGNACRVWHGEDCSQAGQSELFKGDK